MILQQLWKDADAIMTQTGRGTLPARHVYAQARQMDRGTLP